MKKKRKRGRNGGYAMTRDMMNVMPPLIVGVATAGMIGKLYP